MAGSKSDFLELEVLDHVLGGADYVREVTVWIALYSVAPTDVGGGTEFSAGNYARLSVTNNATNWPAAAAGAKANGAEFAFAEATGSNWGTAAAFGIFDAATVGNLLYWGDITVPKSVDIGDTAKFAIGDLTITED